MRGWWYLFHKVLSPIDCADIIAYAQNNKPVQATVGHGGSNTVHPMRSSTVRWLDSADPNLAALNAKLRKCLLEANTKMFGVDYQDFYELQFTEYPATTNGHYDWHEDNCWKPSPDKANPWDRKLSLVVQLSAPESYAGGKLEFDRDPLAEGQFVNQGDIIVFPSINRHRVTPVTAGLRYSLVTWAVGPRWK